MVALSDEGAKRFGQLTAAMVGEKLAIVVGGRVRSAPVVQSPIYGGRLSISLGGSPDPSEAKALAEALSVRSLEAVEIAETEAIEPVAAWRVGLARPLFALFVGLVAFILGAFAWRLLPPRSALPAMEARLGGSVAIRALVAVAAAAAVWFASYIPLATLDGEMVEMVGIGADLPVLSAFSLGLWPVISAFIIVEIIALLVPPLRRLRHAGPAGRAKLLRATYPLAIGFALLQAYFITSWLMTIAPFPGGPTLLRNPSASTMGLTVLTLAAGPAAYVAIAMLIDRRGVGNGYSVILAIGGLQAIWASFGANYHATGWLADPVAGPTWWLLVSILGCAVATAWVLRARVPVAGGGTLRLPTCGIIPILQAGSILGLYRAFQLAFGDGGTGAAGGLTVLTLRETLASNMTQAWWILMIALALLWSWLFSGRAIVGQHRHAFVRATAGSVNYLLVIAVIGWTSAPMALPMVAVAVFTAVLLDLLSEMNARLRFRDLVAIWPLHRVQATTAVLAGLAAADIPAHARGSHHRALLHFFGPFVPITILVPRAHVQRAREILETTGAAVRDFA